MKKHLPRLATGLIGGLLSLVVLFAVPEAVFAGVAAIMVLWAALEYVRLMRPLAGSAALSVPLLAVLGAATLELGYRGRGEEGFGIAALALGLAGAPTLVILARTPIERFLPALGAVAFGAFYFAVPWFGIVRLHEISPWLALLLFAIVWLGDAAAYFVGSAIGRHKMSPNLSPKKSWEGAIAGLLMGVVAMAVWCQWRLGSVAVPLLGLAASTGIVAQFGDLTESALKRGAGVKDSGTILPGHGGILDRLDATLLAAPFFYAGWSLFGPAL